jgi:hypothetical protein
MRIIARKPDDLPGAGPGPNPPLRTLWAGLGNRSGLHDYAETLLAEKWAKSGDHFQRRLLEMPRGTKVETWRFSNTTRDRGRWFRVATFTL